MFLVFTRQTERWPSCNEHVVYPQSSLLHAVLRSSPSHYCFLGGMVLHKETVKEAHRQKLESREGFSTRLHYNHAQFIQLLVKHACMQHATLVSTSCPDETKASSLASLKGQVQMVTVKTISAWIANVQATPSSFSIHFEETCDTNNFRDE